MFNGKMKALTFSYDDGVTQDRQLCEIFNFYNMKCTFNLNSGLMTENSRWSCNGKPVRRLVTDEIGSTYRGHEIAMHFLTHPHPTELSDDALEHEIHEDIINLEKMFGQKIIGSAYPFGEYDQRIIAALKKHGIKYARTVDQTQGFDLQTELMSFKPTCHHNDDKLMELAEFFAEANPEKPMLFYVWGHSYEFDGYDNWKVIENLCSFLAGKNDIFCATNSEIII
ncbi:MAG: polysaccharide deacetylase family protein [Oscillospiraceae bacterium]|jgi:peptidoglycan/xylan/chitin deacetylase (PgdA/CDA1 family)